MREIRTAHRNLLNVADKSLLLLGRQASWHMQTKKNIRTLADAEFKVYSQWGEDGILEWLLQNLPISSTRFVEFGVEDYREANTRFLLQNRNWKGLVMDGSAAHVGSIQNDDIYWRHDLTATTAFITAENINDLLIRHGFEGDLGVLSIDIDGNDCWVLDSIEVASASILVCEYNAVLGDIWPIAIPYNPDFSWPGAHDTGLYCGASIAALCYLANLKGYEFVGTNSHGVNAFFVRREYIDLLRPRIERLTAYPSLIRESRKVDGRLIYTQVSERHHVIKGLPLENVVDGQIVKLSDLGEIYSDEWLAAMNEPNFTTSERVPAATAP